PPSQREPGARTLRRHALPGETIMYKSITKSRMPDITREQVPSSCRALLFRTALATAFQTSNTTTFPTPNTTTFPTSNTTTFPTSNTTVFEKCSCARRNRLAWNRVVTRRVPDTQPGALVLTGSWSAFRLAWYERADAAATRLSPGGKRRFRRMP